MYVYVRDYISESKGFYLDHLWTVSLCLNLFLFIDYSCVVLA